MGTKNVNSDIEGTLYVSEGLRTGLTIVTSTPYTVLSTDQCIDVDTDTIGGAATLNLPSAATLGAGFTYFIKKNGSSGAVTIDPSGSETIDSATTEIISVELDYRTIISDGTNWLLKNRGIPGSEFGAYADDYYTAGGNEFALTGGTTYNLPCNAQNSTKGNVTYQPADRAFYTPETLNYDNEASGPFQEGETITGGTSGATGVITHLVDNGTSGTFYLSNVTGTFQDNEQVTGGTSSATADVDGTITEGKINALEGDTISYTVEFTAEPQTANTTYIDVWVDIGGSVGELYRRTTSLPKGSGNAVSVISSTDAYCLDTWESNGGVIKILANQDTNIYDIRVVVFLRSTA